MFNIGNMAIGYPVMTMTQKFENVRDGLIISI